VSRMTNMTISTNGFSPNLVYRILCYWMRRYTPGDDAMLLGDRVTASVLMCDASYTHELCVLTGV